MATISFRAEMKNLREEMAKVPGITEAEAKRMVAALNKQLKEAEKASKAAFKEASKGPEGFKKQLQQAEYVAGKFSQAWGGVQKAAKLSAAAVGAVAGAVTALTKGALDEARRQVDGLTDATDDQRAASALLLNQQVQTSRALTSLRTDVLSPLIPVVADTAAGLEALAKQLQETGDAEDIGEKLARGYREDLIPALTAFGMTADYVYTGIKAAITQAIELNKTLFYSLTGRFKKATDAAAEMQDAWADLGDIKDRWGEWQDVILETNAELDDTVRISRKGGDEIARLTSIAHAAYLDLLDPMERVAAQRDDDLAQIDALARHVKDLSLVEEAREAVAMRAENEIAELRRSAAREAERLAQRVADEEQKRLDLVTDYHWQAWDARMEAAAAAADEIAEQADMAIEAQIAEAEATTDAMNQIADGAVQSFEQVAAAVERMAWRVADEKIAAAEDGSRAEKEEAVEAFKVAQAVAIVSASISTALAMIQGLSAGLSIGGPQGIALGIATMAFAATAGGIAIGEIASESPPSFEVGGRVPGSGPVPIIAHGGEEVATREAARRNPGIVAAMNRGEQVGGGTQVVVLKLNTRTIQAMEHESLRTGTGPLSERLRALRLYTLGHYLPAGYGA